MGFWEKFKEFDKRMSEPALIIEGIRRTRIRLPDDFFQNNDKIKETIKELIEENMQLREQLEGKRAKSIDVKYRKLLE